MSNTSVSIASARGHTDATTDVDTNDGGKSYYLYRTTSNTLLFDTVDLSSYTGVNLWLWLYVPTATFESNDYLTMTLVFNDDTTFTLLNITGGTDDGGFAPYKGQWCKIGTSTCDILDAKTSVYLKVKNYVSEGGEDSWIDDVFVVPEPATLARMGFGMAGILWVNRRRSGKRARGSPRQKGDGSLLPKRPFGCSAQKTPVPFLIRLRRRHAAGWTPVRRTLRRPTRRRSPRPCQGACPGGSSGPPGRRRRQK